jgi:hypothetical protein
MISTVLTVDVICVMVAGSATLYLLPVLIGLARQVPDPWSLVAVNVLLGWTVIGWVAALAMALRSPRPAGPPPWAGRSFAPPAPCPPAPAGWAGPPGPPPPRPGVPPPLALPPRPGVPAGPAGYPGQQ